MSRNKISVPNPGNMIELKLTWMVYGAIITVVSYGIVDQLNWAFLETRLFKEAIIYLPLLLINITAHLILIVKKKPVRTGEKYIFRSLCLKPFRGCVGNTLPRHTKTNWNITTLKSFSASVY